jgi:hypothetical protein
LYSEIKTKEYTTKDPLNTLETKLYKVKRDSLTTDSWTFLVWNSRNKIKIDSIRLEDLVNGKILYGIKKQVVIKHLLLMKKILM